MTKPYVYIIQNNERTHWYVGMRYKNKCPAIEDTKYWGSSKYLKELIKNTGKENWTKTIVKEFVTPEEASAHEVELLELMWDWPGRVNKNINGYVDQSDLEVKAKHRAGVAKRSEDPVWRAKHRVAIQKRSENPVWQANTRAANQKRSENPVWQANNRAGALKRAKPFIATNIETGEEFFCESTRCDQVKALKLHPGAVSDCLNGRREQHKGFTFRFA